MTATESYKEWQDWALELDEKSVYVVEVSESSTKSHLLRGRGPLIRRGSNDKPMTNTELEEIIDLRNGRKPI